MMKDKILYYEKMSKKIRKHIIYMHAKSNSSHVGSALSCVEILVSLYFDILKINPKNPNAKNRDRFILSKGHAASALYATLAKRKFFPQNILTQYCCNGGKLPGHSTIHCVPGVEVSTGSLGHGLSIGTGIALAAKYDKLNYRVFVLLSDGECDEGSVWESALFASHHHLDNLTVIIDYNKMQAMGWTEQILQLEPLTDKWTSFGWVVKEINGHNFKQIINALRKIPYVHHKPSLVIAHTIKGKGVSFMENQLPWHYKAPSEEEFKQALKELK